MEKDEIDDILNPVVEFWRSMGVKDVIIHTPAPVGGDRKFHCVAGVYPHFGNCYIHVGFFEGSNIEEFHKSCYLNDEFGFLSALAEIQDKEIKAHRDLSDQEIELINEGKALVEQLNAFANKVVPAVEGIDQRWLSVAKTDLQKGVMALVRFIKQPTTF